MTQKKRQRIVSAFCLVAAMIGCRIAGADDLIKPIAEKLWLDGAPAGRDRWEPGSAET